MSPTFSDEGEQRKLLELRHRFQAAEREARRGAHELAFRGFMAAARGYRERGMHQVELAVWTSAATLRSDGRYHEGAADACMALGRGRDSAQHLDAARRLYLGGEDPEALERVLRKLVRLAPNHVPSLSQLGLLAFERGASSFGRKCLERAVDLCRHAGDRAATDELERRLAELLRPAAVPCTSTADLSPTTRPTRLDTGRRRFRFRGGSSPDEISEALRSSAGIAPIQEHEWKDQREDKQATGLSLDDLAQFLADS